MTLIVGLKTADTVVLAAETEEAVGITAKRNIFKLSRIEGRNWVVVVGGAGDSAIVENATRLSFSLRVFQSRATLLLFMKWGFTKRQGITILVVATVALIVLIILVFRTTSVP